MAANHINSGLEDGEVIQHTLATGAPKKNNAKNNSKNKRVVKQDIKST